MPQQTAPHAPQFIEQPQYYDGTASETSAPPSISASVISEPTTDQGSVVNQDAFSSYILDSGCNPTVTRAPLSPPTTRDPVYMPNGSTVQATTSTAPVVLSTPCGQAYRVAEHSSSPSMQHNLLSVARLTHDNGCHVIFRPRAAYITKPWFQPDPVAIAAAAPLQQGLQSPYMYTLPLSH